MCRTVRLKNMLTKETKLIPGTISESMESVAEPPAVQRETF